MSWIVVRLAWSNPEEAHPAEAFGPFPDVDSAAEYARSKDYADMSDSWGYCQLGPVPADG